MKKSIAFLMFLVPCMMGLAADSSYGGRSQKIFRTGPDRAAKPKVTAAAADPQQWPIIFEDNFNDESSIDRNASGRPGFKWYPQMFWGYGTNAPHFWKVSGGNLAINGANNHWNDTLHTAHPADNAQGWEGTAFAGGSGIFFEANIAVENVGAIGGAGWPAFWLDSLKRETGKGGEMLGHPGVTEACEPDIFEYQPEWNNNDPNCYGTYDHDWVDNAPGGQFAWGEQTWVTIRPGDFHRYGLLYIPASSANGWNGYIQAFFDGTAGAKIPSPDWRGNQTYAGPMPPTWDSFAKDNYMFSEMDRDLFLLILGSSTGGTETMKVDWVKVRAADPSASLVTLPAGQPLPTPTPPVIEPTPTPPQPTPTPTPPGGSQESWENWIKLQNDWIRAHPPYPD